MLDLSNIKACSEVNPAIEGGKFTIVDGKPIFSIPELGVTFTTHGAIESLLINGAKKVLSATTASQKTRINAAIVETIDVWREDKSYLTTGEKEKALKPVTITASGTSTKKLPYTRLDIEAAMRDVTSLDDPRVKVIEAMDDEQFAEFMVLCNDEDFVIDALDLLAKRLREKQEREATDKKAQFAAMLAKAKGL